MRYRLLAALMLSALALAACGREVGQQSADDTSDGGETTTEEGGESAAESVACEVDEVDGDLLLYNWSEYMDPDLLTAFSEEYGVDATEDTFTSNEALLAQIRAGGADYDVIVPSDYMVDLMIEEGVLLELDHDAIPNLDNVAEEFADPPYDPGMRHSMPYLWGTTGIGVDLEMTGPDPEATWGWLFDEEMGGQLDRGISILDDPREGMAAALYYLGYGPNTQNEDELQEAADLITQAGPWTVTYTSDQFPDLLLTGETAAAHGYSGDLLDEFGGDEQYAYLIPEEGAIKWVDNMAILADASHPCTAHTFINFVLDAENGAQLSNWAWYASPNAAAEEFLDDELRVDESVFPPEETMERLQYLENTGEAEILYTDLFTQAQG